MNVAKPLAVATTLVPLLLLTAAAASQPSPNISRAPIVRDGRDFGCRITVKATNKSRTDIWLMSEDSRVRAKVTTRFGSWWGTWKRVPMSNRRIRPGESATMTADLDLKCKARRQYQFEFKRGANTANKNYGGTGTTRTTIDLGDAATLF